MASNNKKVKSSWIFAEVSSCLLLWALLIVLKAVGYIDMHWAVVLSGIVWISWLWFALTALLVLVIHGLVCLKQWLRRRKVDRRIIRQAKAAGVWDKPQVLGGRALELKAWKLYKIRRKSGETDKELRLRYIGEMIESGYGIRPKKPNRRNLKRLCKIAERRAEEHGYKVAGRKIRDGREIELSLVDESVPKDLTVKISYENPVTEEARENE